MKVLWAIIVIVLVLNTLAFLGLLGWLYNTGRIDKQRIMSARQVFELTIEEEKRQGELAKELEEQSRQQALDIARLESVKDGPITLADRLLAEQQADELSVQRVQRLRRDIDDLRKQLTLAKQLLAKQHEELTAQKESFEQAVAKETKLKNDQDFQQTVKMYQQLKPKQVKQMFQQLLNQDMAGQVVEYLAAMQIRKAAAVIREFKSPAEIVQAADLLQSLRERGLDFSMEDLGNVNQAQQSLAVPNSGDIS